MCVIEASQTEIENLRRPIEGETDIGWLHIPVSDPPIVSEGEPLTDLKNDVDPGGESEGLFQRHDMPQVDSLGILHDDIREIAFAAEIENRNDIWMMETSG